MADYIYYNNQTGIWTLQIPRGRYCDTYIYDAKREPIGKGGMGVVWLGTDMRTKRPVAIKRVHDRYAQIKDIRERARLEAQKAFRHQNLVEMLGCAESVTGQGPLFIISNYVQGENIDKFISANFRTLSDESRQRHIVEMLYPVLNALEYIHASDIVHLDIKPSNIMVEAGRNIRLMDMGISLVSQRVQVSNNHQSQPVGNNSVSSLMGTPKYAAPEQFGDENGCGEIKPSTDIYEFGITLYELLTGINPYIGTSLDETYHRHINEILPLTQGISEPVLEVLRKATRVYQDDRYQNVGELRAALEAALDYKPSLFKKLRDRITKRNK